ncbi:MAG: VTT domain-containing protein [Candidatus Diapherotrites archaeon]|nr:VTT domain-containing protein [Candidatus Diapherotrites archaeon]
MVDPILFAQELVMQYHLLGVFVSTMLFYTIVLPLPADLIVFFAGSLGTENFFLSPLFVGVVAGVAATIGGMLAYAIGLEADKHLLKEKHGKKYKQAADYLTKYGFWAIAFFALTPLPMDAMGVFAGALRYDWKKFALASFAGRLPRCLILAYAGYGGMSMVLQFFQWWL